MTDSGVELPGMPRDENGPVFREPWEAQSFAMTLALHRVGLFQWPEWAAMLAEEIRRARAAGGADTGASYYRHCQAALERMIVEKGLSDAQAIGRYRDAWAHAAGRTPHGMLIQLLPGDFRS